MFNEKINYACGTQKLFGEQFSVYTYKQSIPESHVCDVRTADVYVSYFLYACNNP